MPVVENDILVPSGDHEGPRPRKTLMFLSPILLAFDGGNGAGTTVGTTVAVAVGEGDSVCMDVV